MPKPDRPWFLWDVDVSEADLRERLRHPDAAIRGQWQGALPRVLDSGSNIGRHLGPSGA